MEYKVKNIQKGKSSFYHSILVLIIYFICPINDLWGQGLNIYVGTSSAKNESAIISPNSHPQTGYHFGLDARLNEGKMYFVLGGQFHSIGIIPQASFSLNPEGEKINFIKLRVGLGYDLFYITDLIKIRGKTLGSFDLINSIPKSSNIDFNEAVGGVILGLGTDVLNFTFDLDLEIGLINAIHNVPDSKYDFVSFSFGIIF